MADYFKKYTDDELKNVKMVEKDILRQIIIICEKNDLKWTIIGGTALGAVRHGGFIPWDDDIDIAMPREDYEKFLKIAPNELPEGYFFQNYITDCGYNGYFSKIRKDGTLFAESANLKLKMHHGIFVDIFPLDNLPDSESEYKSFLFKLRILYQIYMSKSNVGTAANQKHKKIALAVRRLIGIFTFFISKKKAFEMLDKQFKMYRDKQVKRLGFAYLPSMTLYYDELYPLQKMRFEDIEVFAPNKIKDYLERDYGNFIELPPKDKRINHRPVILSFNSDNK